ncbi:MAG: hypothetical protein WCO06_01430 [Candidatus Roizmanbacteria bacterium]
MNKQTYEIKIGDKYGVTIAVGSPLQKALYNNFEAQKQLNEVIDLLKKQILQAFINELESNSNKDGSISPNLQHWIESKKIQLSTIIKEI